MLDQPRGLKVYNIDTNSWLFNFVCRRKDTKMEEVLQGGGSADQGLYQETGNIHIF